MKFILQYSTFNTIRYNSQLKVSRITSIINKLNSNSLNQLNRIQDLNSKVQESCGIKLKEYEESAKSLRRILIFKTLFVEHFEILSRELQYINEANKNLFHSKLDLSINRSYSSIKK
jgi:hypothetical protein